MAGKLFQKGYKKAIQQRADKQISRECNLGIIVNEQTGNKMKGSHTVPHFTSSGLAWLLLFGHTDQVPKELVLRTGLSDCHLRRDGTVVATATKIHLHSTAIH